MNMLSTQKQNGQLNIDDLQRVIYSSLSKISDAQKVLLIHPDYSRHDFTDMLCPLIYEFLKNKGLRQLDTLNAAGTHRSMSQEELGNKLGMSHANFPLLGTMFNHEFDNPKALTFVGDIDGDFVENKTQRLLTKSLPIYVNKLVTNGYDAIIAINGTVPHEATGFSGGTKIFFPGISGPEVTAFFHWAAVLIGIPEIIGKLDNAARDVVNEGTRIIFEKIGNQVPIVSLNMVYVEDEAHTVIPKGLFSGIGLQGFAEALKKAAALSSNLHIRYIDETKDVIVQRLPTMYDEIWTAGKGSYKLQRPGVLAKGAEIILFAPHINCFHSNKLMDEAMRKIGYHGRDYVVDYCKKNPDFNKNVASHMINVRGLGRLVNNQEEFDFNVTLATAICEADCKAIGLGYRDPASIKRENFQGSKKLWIDEGGQWLYSRK